MSTLDERSREEATRDVVFLLQSRELKLHSLPAGFRVSDDGELQQLTTGVGTALKRPKRWTLAAALDEGLVGDDGYCCVSESWRTIEVYLKRETAEAFANATHYRYPDGWRVFGVPAGRDMAKAIRDAEAAHRLHDKVKALLPAIEQARTAEAGHAAVSTILPDLEGLNGGGR